MTDDLHPETPLAKIRRGETSQDKTLYPEIQKVTDASLTWNLLANWWNRTKLQNLAELIEVKIKTAKGLQELQGIKNEVRDHFLFDEIAMEIRRLAKTNELIIQQNANILGIPVARYGDYTLELLKFKLQTEAKISQARVETESERISIEETFKASITRASVVFEKQQRLIKELAELETSLQALKDETLSPSVKRRKRKRLQEFIFVKEEELRASQQETLSQGNGARTGTGSQSETPGLAK